MHKIRAMPTAIQDNAYLGAYLKLLFKETP